MTSQEISQLKEIYNGNPKEIKYHLGVFISKQESKGNNWTDNQRKAFHKGCQELADHLNETGRDMRAVLKHDVDIPWTKDAVKNFLFRPIMKAMYGYESHTELKKIEEVSKLWDVTMKYLGQNAHVEYMEFPHREKENDTLSAHELRKKLEKDGVI